MLDVVRSACRHANCTEIGCITYKCEPRGVIAILGLLESHITIHTFPEHMGVMIDVFTCGNSTTPDLAVKFLHNYFKPKYTRTIFQERGGDKIVMAYIENTYI